MMKKVLSKNYKGTEATGIITRTCPRFIKVGAFLLLFFLLTIIFPVRVLQASNYKSGEYLKAWLIKRGDIFEVEYVHSVQLTPVSEIYFIDDDYNIILEESYFNSYGAGLPATTPYQFEIRENRFRIYNIKEIMGDLVYRTGAVRADHHIKINNKSYSFLTFSKSGQGVKFIVKKSSLFKHLVKEVLQ